MKEIKFTTKFDLGQKIVYIDLNDMKIKESVITKLSFEVAPDGVNLWYKLENGEFVREKDMFASREELIANL